MKGEICCIHTSFHTWAQPWAQEAGILDQCPLNKPPLLKFVELKLDLLCPKLCINRELGRGLEISWAPIVLRSLWEWSRRLAGGESFVKSCSLWIYLIFSQITVCILFLGLIVSQQSGIRAECQSEVTWIRFFKATVQNTVFRNYSKIYFDQSARKPSSTRSFWYKTCCKRTLGWVRRAGQSSSFRSVQFSGVARKKKDQTSFWGTINNKSIE